ncbi:hypothetical protein [Psychrobacillus sp. OK032]|uniref:hypothetical protein n=1 Tax=Psychrobacillus sp. OK032 TaxID=1884358 RepID=UPI0008C8B453|nr:hypothetical protein [Psychrobacillus sp. OK032]SES37243.1 hypothetical protein SAMN05518872_10946 [Psychrobacillus sp. OK032]
MIYNVMLFFHILGTVVMFVAVGITLTAMIAMLHAKKTEALRDWSSLAVKMDGLLPFSVILILLPALYLVFTTWGWGVAWINISLAALVVMSFMGPAINLRRLKIILTAANAETKSVPSSSLLETVRDRTLWNSVIIMTMLAIAILFLMTVKLALVGSLIVFGIAIILGLIVTNMVLKSALTSNSSSAIANQP